jgi:hypothetical protein
LDVALSLGFLRDGLFLGQPVPPFEAITHPTQRAALERMRLPLAERPGINAFDPLLGWTNRPDSRSEDGLASVNLDGLRGPRRHAREPDPGRTRIACFGDSYTFGDEVRDEWAYPYLLEELYPDYEALNLGVSAYGTDQALLRFRREGLWGAQVVCIGVLLENIGRNVNRYRPLWYTRSGAPVAKPRFLLESGALELLEQPYADEAALLEAITSGSVLDDLAEGEHWRGPWIPTGKLSSLVRLGGAAWALQRRQPRRLWQEEAGEPFQVTLGLLETFHREALAAGAEKAVVLIFPYKDDFAGYLETGERYWQPLLAELERRGIAAIDLVPPLAAKHRRHEHDPGISIYYGGHLSSVGNAQVADSVVAWLEGPDSTAARAAVER